MKRREFLYRLLLSSCQESTRYTFFLKNLFQIQSKNTLPRSIWGDMKHLPKLFIETTVFNFLFEGKQGQKHKDATRLFDEISKGRYKAYTSQAVLRELEAAPEEKRERMMALYTKFIEDILKSSEEAEHLAKTYIEKRIIPEKYRTDALHIAIAAVNNLDFVVSFNQSHIVKTKTMIGAGFVNLRHGFKQIGLGTPMEVLEYDP